MTYFSTSAWFLTEGRGSGLCARRPMRHVVWLLVFILNFACAFRFPPTSMFIVTPSVDRFPTKAEDPYPAMRRLAILCQTPTWKFHNHGGLLLSSLLSSFFYYYHIIVSVLLVLFYVYFSYLKYITKYHKN